MNNSSGFGMEMRSGEVNLPSEQQLQNCFFNPAWESSVDHNDPFESALSSIVSSPAASNAGAGGEGVMLRELIGRLGSICNSGEISPESYIGGAQNSTNTSCYTTPLNSPPKHMRTHLAGAQFPPAPFSTDPGFAERAARYSNFSGNPLNIVGSQAPNVPAKASSPELGDSREGSSVSDQIPGGVKDGNGRKRKSKAAGKDTRVASENEESKAKKSKQEEKTKEEDQKQPEPLKDYIHVRARRGQATDSHSLAERVRREKISERMKFLQDLVPGCNKVTGKAVMLDEIINYVQSLQRQVEFLSMKLSTVNPRTDFNMEALLSKEMLQSRDMYPMDSSIPYGYQPQQAHYISNGTSMPLPSMDGFGEVPAPQVLGFWQDDLQSLVQMGFVPNQAQSFHGSVAAGQMKVEP